MIRPAIAGVAGVGAGVALYGAQYPTAQLYGRTVCRFPAARGKLARGRASSFSLAARKAIRFSMVSEVKKRARRLAITRAMRAGVSSLVEGRIQLSSSSYLPTIDGRCPS